MVQLHRVFFSVCLRPAGPHTSPWRKVSVKTPCQPDRSCPQAWLRMSSLSLKMTKGLILLWNSLAWHPTHYTNLQQYMWVLLKLLRNFFSLFDIHAYCVPGLTAFVTTTLTGRCLQCHIVTYLEDLEEWEGKCLMYQWKKSQITEVVKKLSTDVLCLTTSFSKGPLK